ncbi:hypothetical protein ACP275_14G194100 [Erythranthe tilingii]
MLKELREKRHRGTPNLSATSTMNGFKGKERIVRAWSSYQALYPPSFEYGKSKALGCKYRYPEPNSTDSTVHDPSTIEQGFWAVTKGRTTDSAPISSPFSVARFLYEREGRRYLYHLHLRSTDIASSKRCVKVEESPNKRSNELPRGVELLDHLDIYDIELGLKSFLQRVNARQKRK